MPTIILGVSASIAAYKAAEVASALVKDGVNVHPVLTRDAAKFVGPATFRALTGHPCPVDVFDEPFPGDIGHIELARRADLVAIVPASMDIMAKLAHGFADDMLTATVSATTAPVLLAPGMNSVMWASAANQANLATLTEYGYYFVDPVSGRLACRTEGIGKMAEPDVICDAIRALLVKRASLAGKRVLITAGPTREAIDAVRYISNRSSGKMGYALAAAAAKRGGSVTLVSGPVSLAAPAGVDVVAVVTAEEMKAATLACYGDADIVIAAAAVADYRPGSAASGKIKKSADAMMIDLTPTADILVELGRLKQAQVLVGFAAETDDVLDNAAAKLAAKNLDWIVANDVSRADAGFEADTNAVTIIGRDGSKIDVPLKSKREIAEDILDVIAASPKLR